MVRGESRSAGRGPSRRDTARDAEADQLPVAELVRRCRAQDTEAWQRFVHRYGRLIYATIHRKVQLNETEAEDAFQDTILAIHKSLPKLEDPEKIVSWIVQRHCVSRWAVATR